MRADAQSANPFARRIRNVRFNDNVVVNLGAGIYDMRNLSIGKNVTINVNDATVLEIDRRFDPNDNLLFGTNGGYNGLAKILVGGFGDNPSTDRSAAFSHNAEIHAQFFSPNSWLDLGGGNQLYGRFRADRITGDPNNNVYMVVPEPASCLLAAIGLIALLGFRFAFTIPTGQFLRYTLAFLWLLAFSSATHDIGADGFYMLALSEKEQSFFVGIRSTFYRISTLSGQGLLVILAGLIQTHTGLPKVEVEVAATPGVALLEKIGTNSTPFLSPSFPQTSVLILAQSDKIEIAPEPRDKKEVAELIGAAKRRNTELGFYRQEPAKSADWLSRFFSALGRPFKALGERLEPWLREHFGAARTKNALAGNIGVAQLQLSGKPSKDTVVTVAQGSGDKNIALVEGARLIFTPDNWNKGALVVFQLDPKLRTASVARFEIRSGNVPLSWSITFGFLFLHLSILRPVSQICLARTGERPARDG